MTEYVKIGKEDFEIKDWVTLKEYPNKFVMEFRCNGNIKAARAMVNAKLSGLNGKYCISDSEGIQETVGKVTVVVKADTAADMDARSARGKAGPMPGSTRDF